MNIYFIRHGQTTGDVEDRYGGNYDDHLTELGKEQAEALTNKFEGRCVQAIFSSPLIRARETAEILAKQIGAPVEIDSDLREGNHYGILTGMPRAEARERYPAEVKKLKDRSQTVEGAEPYSQFSERIIKAIERRADDSRYTCVILVSHGGPMHVLFRKILKRGEIDPGDCSFAVLQYKMGKFELKESDGIKFL